MKEALCAIQAYVAPTGCSTSRQFEEIHNHENQESNLNLRCVMILNMCDLNLWLSWVRLCASLDGRRRYALKK